MEHAYTQAYALCQQVGETPELGPVLHGLWRLYFARPQLHTAREIGDTMLRHAHDPALVGLAHYVIGLTWFHLGALPAARTHLEEASHAISSTSPVLWWSAGHDPGMNCRVYVQRFSGSSGTQRKP